MRFTGERRALAAAVLAFYGLAYLMMWVVGPGEQLGRLLVAMAGVYGVAFLGVVAGYFWARWYAVGVGLSGVVSAAVGAWQMGPEPVLLFLGGTHGLVALCLWGEGMARGFDGRTEWRARFHLDENAVHRLGRAVIRVGMSLPYVLAYALAPRAGGLVDGVLALGALGLAVGGLVGLLRLRTWGLASLAGAVALLLPAVLGGGMAASESGTVAPGAYALPAALLLAAALAPFAQPLYRYLRGR
jgi:hypothetical protein